MEQILDMEVIVNSCYMMVIMLLFNNVSDIKFESFIESDFIIKMRK